MREVQKLSFTDNPNYDQLKGYLKNLMGGMNDYIEKIKN
jgi:hypothetical protein